MARARPLHFSKPHIKHCTGYPCIIYQVVFLSHLLDDLDAQSGAWPKCAKICVCFLFSEEHNKDLFDQEAAILKSLSHPNIVRYGL